MPSINADSGSCVTPTSAREVCFHEANGRFMPSSEAVPAAQAPDALLSILLQNVYAGK